MIFHIYLQYSFFLRTSYEYIDYTEKCTQISSKNRKLDMSIKKVDSFWGSSPISVDWLQVSRKNSRLFLGF